MTAGSSFSNVFTGAATKPSQVSYLNLSIGVDTTLYWPTETVAGQPYVATQLDVTATASGLQLQMPPATSGALGQATIITNIGANTFSLIDNDGNAIASITAGLSWLITLTTNATNAGTWRALQLASTVSTAVAASLAGAGLEANGTLLQEHILTVTLAVDSTLLAAHRAMLIDWSGAAGTLQLDTISNLTVGWFCYIVNNGTGILTIATSGGATINNLPEPVVVLPGGGVIVVCDTGNFNTVGIQMPPPLPSTTHGVLFTADGTFTTPSNSTIGTVYKCSLMGGGAGGGTGIDPTLVAAGGGGGGGGGGCVVDYLSNILPGTAVAITVGLGGAGGGSGGAAANGAPGTASTLVVGLVTLTANGGAGGSLVPVVTVLSISAGGAGGGATGGTINAPGAPGGWGLSTGGAPTEYVAGGNGGGGFNGAGGGIGGVSTVGGAITAGGGGTAPGAGGGGGATNGAGGDGAAGQVLIEYVL